MQRRVLTLLFAIVVACLVRPTNARAACGDLILESIGTVDWQGAIGSYDIFDASSYAQPVSIRVTKINGGTCTFAIGVDEGQAGSYSPRRLRHGADRLDYNLYTDSALTNILTDLGGGGQQLVGAFTTKADTETLMLTYYYSIPPLQVVPGTNGNYADRVRFTVYDTTTNRARGRASQNVSHRAQVARTAELSLVETGAPFDANDVSQFMDFGIFFTGQSLSFDLRGRANTAFDIEMQSANGGLMVHTSFPASQVPYTLTSNGNAVALGAGPVVIGSFAGGATSSQGELYAVTVTIGSLAGTYGGLHQDQITVTLVAR